MKGQSGESHDSKYDGFRKIALLTGIPLVLMGGVMVGYFLGDWMDRYFLTDPWFTIGLTGIGTIAGVRETIGLIKRAGG